MHDIKHYDLRSTDLCLFGIRKFHDRNFIVKMHSVVYYQLGESATTCFFLLWKRPGYATHKIPDAVSFSFGFETRITDGYIISVFIR